MLNLVVAYDDNDSELADYFESSYTSIVKSTEGIGGITTVPICGLDCTEKNINDVVTSLNGEKFCFVGLSHGDHDILLTDNDVYVSEKNCHLFKSSLFYSLGCQTGLTLGMKLIENECTSFVGYFDDAFVTHEEFYDIYIECETFSLKQFLSNDITLDDTLNNMKAHYDQEIAKLYHADEILVAMELIHNRDSIDILGNRGLLRSDLFTQG